MAARSARLFWTFSMEKNNFLPIGFGLVFGFGKYGKFHTFFLKPSLSNTRYKGNMIRFISLKSGYEIQFKIYYKSTLMGVPQILGGLVLD